MRKTLRRAAAWALLASAAGCALLGQRDRETPEQAAVRTEEDARIRRAVEARLAAEPSIGPGTVRVEVNRRDVHLHGTVQGMGALQCAVTNAGLVEGVRTVVDFLVLERGPREVNCLAPRTGPAPPGG